MKILLINPPNSVKLDNDFVINIYQPIGLAYLASSLVKHGYRPKILDALAEGFDQTRIVGDKKIVGLSYNEIQKRIRKFHPSVVGIAMPFSFQAQEAHQVAALVKKVNSQIIVVAGGVHATIQPDKVLQDKNINFLVRGEGEETFPKLLGAISKSGPFSRIPNISYRRTKNRIIHNPRTLPISQLDRLPNPARYLLPLDRYHDAAKSGRVIESLLAYGQKRTGIITSRGCPFNCTFCSVHLTMTKMWRARSPENVVAEIEECVRKHGIRYFDILDDNFTFDPIRAKNICRLIISRKLKISWSTPNGIRADRLDDELVSLMKDSGCLQVKIAPESGSQRVLTGIIRKNLDLNKVKEAVILCRKHRLSVEAFFVIGFPEEKLSDIKKTIAYAKELRRLGCDYCYFFIATPFYGTEMYSDAVSKGYLDEHNYNLQEIFTTANYLLTKSPNYTSKQLMDLHRIASRINPPVTKIRLKAALTITLTDPKRILRFALNYFNYFLPRR